MVDPIVKFGICGALMMVMALLSFESAGADTWRNAPWASMWSFSGYLKNETAYRFQEPRTYTKIRNIAYLESRGRLSERSELVAVGRAYYDLAYDLFDYDTIAARSERDSAQPLSFVEGLAEQKDSPVAETRELYLDILLDNLDIRIGKQFVIWGVITGVRIVDEINPMDFRELILPDLLDYRIPLWTARLDYYFDEHTLELLWIPDIRFHKPAPPGSEWELLQEVPGTQYPDSYTLSNSEVGLKFSSKYAGTEYSLSYFYTWDDFPVIFRRVLIDPNDVTPPPDFSPRYRRMHIFGSTFRRLVRGQVVKAELAYVSGKYFGLTLIDRDNDGYMDHEGVLRLDHVRWGVGLDFNIWRTDFSPSFTQWILPRYDSALIQDRFDNSFNIFIRKEFAGLGAHFELLGIYLINLREVYLKPKFVFKATDRFQFAVGMDTFFGNKSATGVAYRDGRPDDPVSVEQRTRFIGNFHDNDRVFFEFTYSF